MIYTKVVVYIIQTITPNLSETGSDKTGSIPSLALFFFPIKTQLLISIFANAYRRPSACIKEVLCIVFTQINAFFHKQKKTKINPTRLEHVNFELPKGK